MWNRLNQTDIAQARQQLDLRRDETLRKHAEEIQSLAAVQAAIEQLDNLASAFSHKFKKMHGLAKPQAAPAPPPAPTDAPTAGNPSSAVEPAIMVAPTEHRVAHRHGVDKPAAKGRHSDQPGYHRTNFEVFSHAIAKNERGW